LRQAKNRQSVAELPFYALSALDRVQSVLSATFSRCIPLLPSDGFELDAVHTTKATNKSNYPELHRCVRSEGHQGLCEFLRWRWTAWQPAQQFALDTASGRCIKSVIKEKSHAKYTECTFL
jgi:hypothetical protein